MLPSLKVICAKRLVSLDSDDELPNKVFARFWNINFSNIIVNDNLCIDWRLTAINCLASVHIAVTWTVQLLDQFKKILAPFIFKGQCNKEPSISCKTAFKFAAANGLQEAYELLWRLLDDSSRRGILRNEDGEIAQVAALEITGSEYSLNYAWTLAVHAEWPLALKSYHRKFHIEIVTFLLLLKMKKYRLLEMVFDDELNAANDSSSDVQKAYSGSWLQLVSETPECHREQIITVAEQLLPTLDRRQLEASLKNFCGPNWTAAMDLRMLVEKSLNMKLTV